MEIKPVVPEKMATPAVRVSSDEQSIEEIDIFGDTSPGVRRARILADNLSILDRIIIFVCLFLLAYVYGLDGTLRYVYQVRIVRYLAVDFTEKHSALCNFWIWDSLHSRNHQRSP